ncbi:MAG: DUF6726 family protein [Parasphingorhabdus sp.]|uniref:DUF6726 family protein n=1 Tax=Parasphingorhabdus sp. TaxID=2709688 RepID=UPI00329928E1
MRTSAIITTILVSISLSGCVASKIVTAPFKAAGTVVETAVDATTQTQSEKEEDVGRRVLAERKQQREVCLDRAETKVERKQCKRDYEDN